MRREKVMKRFRSKIVLLLLLCSSALMGQTVHSFYLSGEAGESSLLTKLEKSSSSAGVGALIGGGYELQSGHFLLNIGVGIGGSWSRFSFEDMSETLHDVIDDEGDKFDYIFTQKDRRDSYTNLFLQVPFMMGGTWGGFYFLGGMKLNLSMKAWSRVRTTITAAGDYPQFIDPFVDMPEHTFFSDGKFNVRNDTDFKLDPVVSLELGYRFGEYTEGHSGWDVPKNDIRYRIGLFADFGLLNIHKGGNLEFVTFPSEKDFSRDMKSDLQVNDILSTNKASNAVRSLLVGVKFTVLFKLPEKKGCVLCR